jgi:hypothetical protein
VKLQWDRSTACKCLKSQSEILKNFLDRYPSAAVFFLVHDAPPERTLVEVRACKPRIFCTPHSFNLFQFLQDLLRDAYRPLTEGEGIKGLLVLNQRAEECRNVVTG